MVASKNFDIRTKALFLKDLSSKSILVPLTLPFLSKNVRRPNVELI